MCIYSAFQTEYFSNRYKVEVSHPQAIPTVSRVSHIHRPLRVSRNLGSDYDIIPSQEEEIDPQNEAGSSTEEEDEGKNGKKKAKAKSKSKTRAKSKVGLIARSVCNYSKCCPNLGHVEQKDQGAELHWSGYPDSGFQTKKCAS